MAKSTIKIPCPDCKTTMQRISFWNNKVNKSQYSETWFICQKCDMTHQITYTYKPRGKNAKSI